MNNYEKFLPIGSIVLLQKASKRIMITGFCSFDTNDTTKAYDYTGCLYPEGVISSKDMLLFNHNQIAKIYSLGYSDDECKTWLKTLKDSAEEIMKQKPSNE